MMKMPISSDNNFNKKPNNKRYNLYGFAQENAIRKKRNYLNSAKKIIERNLYFLRERFFNDWINGNLDENEVKEYMEFLNIALPKKLGIILIKILWINIKNTLEEKNNWYLIEEIKNILEKQLNKWQPAFVFQDKKNNLVVIANIIDENKWLELGSEIENEIKKCRSVNIVLCQSKINELFLSLPEIYNKLLKEVYIKNKCMPIVSLILNYIDNNYANEELSLKNAAEAVNISPTYLSRLLKQHTGLSFVDYVTNVRMKKAVEMLEDSYIRICEIAEKVGYSSQHYFCTAFKKRFGISPMDYRKEKLLVQSSV